MLSAQGVGTIPADAARIIGALLLEYWILAVHLPIGHPKGCEVAILFKIGVPAILVAVSGNSLRDAKLGQENERNTCPCMPRVGKDSEHVTSLRFHDGQRTGCTPHTAA